MGRKIFHNVLGFLGTVFQQALHQQHLGLGRIHAGPVNIADTELIGMDAADPEQQTKVNLVCSPVVTSRCIYTYNEDHTSIKTYRLLTDELIDRMEAISADITWKEINPVIWSFTDRYLISPLCEVYFEDCVLHVYPGGSVAVLFSDIEYRAEEGGETLADYITILNEDALPYK